MFKPFSAPGGREGLGFRLHVAAGQEALYCYQKKGDEAPAGELELALRAPLLLATAALAPGAKQMISVTLATPEVLECMGGMQIRPGEARSRFQETPMLPAGGGRGALTFECASERNAQQLMDQLSAAGCTLQGLTDRYRLRKEVGRGGFGRVYLAHDTWNGEEVAVKVFLNKPGAKRNQFHPLREATMLRWSEDPLFPHFKAVYEISEREFEDMDLFELGEDGREVEVVSAFALVTEYLPGGELFAFMAQHGPLSEDSARALMLQVLSGLDSLHRRGIMHRDIKPENVLLAGSGSKVKLVDFGLASVVWDEQAAVARVGSVGYIAPEVLTLPCPPQTTQVDCFSAGVLLYTCLAGHGPFQGRNLKEVLVQNLHNSVNMQAMTRFPPGARDLVTQLLETRPEDRPTAGQCLRHPWLRRPRDANSLKVPPRNPFSSCTLESLGETTSRFSHSHGCSMSKASSNRTLSSSSRSSSSSEQSGAEDHGPLNTQPYFPSKSQDSLSVLAVMAATERSSQRVEASGHSARGTASWPHGPVSVAGKQLAKSLSQSISYDFLQPRPSAADGTRSAPVRRALAAGSAGRAPPAGAAGRAARAAGGAPWAAVRGAPADHAQGLQGSGALAARILRVRHRAPLDSGTEASDSEEGPEEEEHCSHGCSVSKTVGPEAARADAGANSSKEARAEAPGERLSGRLSFRGLRQRVAEARSAKGHVPVPRFLLGVGMRPRSAAPRGAKAAPEFVLPPPPLAP